MAAFGTWEYLAKYGNSQVAAAVPIAGEGRPAWATAGCALGDVPIWAFHGLLDDVVNPAGSIEPIEELQTMRRPAMPGSPLRRRRSRLVDQDVRDRRRTTTSTAGCSASPTREPNCEPGVPPSVDPVSTHRDTVDVDDVLQEATVCLDCLR